MRDEPSELKLYSIGVVVEDKKLGEDIIYVTPIEKLSYSHGKIADIKETMTNTLPDLSGKVNNDEVEKTMVLKAAWIPFGHSNRITSPDVIKNETVILFKFSDTDEFYWTTIFREPKIRRLEKVTYMYGNLKEPLKEWDKSSSYWHEVSTVEGDKHIWFKTTRSDGEAFEYDININPTASTLEIFDNDKNGFYIDSKTGKVTVKAKTEIILDAPLITFTGNVRGLKKGNFLGSFDVGGLLSALSEFTSPIALITEVLDSPIINALEVLSAPIVDTIASQVTDVINDIASVNDRIDNL